MPALGRLFAVCEFTVHKTVFYGCKTKVISIYLYQLFSLPLGCCSTLLIACTSCIYSQAICINTLNFTGSCALSQSHHPTECNSFPSTG